MALRVEIDHGRCSGLGLCEAEAPEIFEVQEDGSLTLLEPAPSEDRRAACEAAVASCPTEALRLVEV